MIRGILDRVLGAKAIKLVQAGNECFERGESAEALRFAREAIASYRRAPGAYRLMAKALMPGDDYLTIIGKIHASLKPGSYVEIGVDKGRSMKLIGPNTKAVGIDPFPKIEPGNETSARIFNMFSDDFFKAHNLLEELGSDRVDMAFIDGSHIFEQTLRDIINVEKFSNDRTLMILHDCIPVGRILAERKRATDFWCGDVWKLVDCVKQYRPDLTMRIVLAWPSGLVLITGLNPESTVLQDKYDEIIDAYVSKDLGYELIPEDTLSNYMPSNWELVAKSLGLNDIESSASSNITN